jgi:hypothetical protein
MIGEKLTYPHRQTGFDTNAMGTNLSPLTPQSRQVGQKLADFDSGLGAECADQVEVVI